MGWMNRGKELVTHQVAEAPDGSLEKMANAVAQQLINVGIDGLGTFDSAQTVAKKAIDRAGSTEGAIKDLVASHMRLAGVSGFLTNLGGFVTMPVALPANVVGFYTLATRLSAAIAHVLGHDIKNEAVRSAVLLTLVGADATQVLRGVGAKAISMPTRIATAGLPPAALAVVNKAVAFRIAAQTGRKLLTKVPRAIPVAGGVVGAVMDVSLLHKISKDAQQEFRRH